MKGQWYAVCRVLSEFANYPEQMKACVMKIANDGLATKAPFCEYNTVKQAQYQYAHLAKPLTEWGKYKDINDMYMKQYIVAEFLMSKLGKTPPKYAS